MNDDQSARLYGLDLFGDPIRPASSGPLAARFEFPPFSVLSARDGAWQDRKRAWIGMGIKSEIGRDCEVFAIGDKAQWDGLKANTVSSRNAMAYAGGFVATSAGNAGTSIFDPTLTELCYRWFCPAGGQIVDPFAGGSVRGIVAGVLGYRYHGIDLRPEQVAANEEQRTAIIPDADVRWECGDSMQRLDDAPPADFIFSCPPYGDLERYSDDPLDLSTMEYHTFLAAYKRIILRCARRLKDDRFACFVVGEFRDKRRGVYRGFVADTVKAFQEVGLELYNDAILVTSVGSLPIRVSAQFEGSRKLGKTHQNVLVFVKGNPPRFA